MSEAYFFDTYAIIEMLKGNPAYSDYKYKKMVLTMFNIVELHYKLIRDFNKELADDLVEKYSKYVIDVDLKTIKEANEYKLLHRKKKLSIPDVIGYFTAKKCGLKFLTGDSQFNGRDGVEFVK